MDTLGTRWIWLRHTAAGLLGLASVLLPVARGLTVLHPSAADVDRVARTVVPVPRDASVA